MVWPCGRKVTNSMDDKALINLYTEKSLAGLKEEHFQKLWEPGDHMYKGEFVSPTRPETYFASDAEVDAYREALARMDGTIDAPTPVPYATYAESEVQEQSRPGRDPFIEALSNSTTQSGSGAYRVVEDDGDDDDNDDRDYNKRSHDDDDDDDDDRRDYRRDDDDDDDRRDYRRDDDDDD